MKKSVFGLLFVAIAALDASSFAQTAKPKAAPSQPAKKASSPTKKSKAEFPENHTFELPILGRIRCHARPGLVRLKGRDGKTHELKLTFCYTTDGRCIRAEMEKKEAIPRLSPAELTTDYKATGNQILGIPTGGPHVSMETIIQQTNIPDQFDELTRLEVTFVDYQRPDEPARPVFIVNYWGLKGGVLSPRFGDDDATFRKSRMVFSAEGHPLLLDNLL